MNYGKMIRCGIVALMAGVAPAAMAADGCPMMGGDNPPPPQKQKGDRPMRPMMERRQGMMPRGPLNEEETAKFADLNGKLKMALEDFRKDGSDANKAKVKDALTNLVGAIQQYDVTRCEKALARAKAKAGEKDAMVERMFKRMTEQPKDGKGNRPQRMQKGKKAPRPDDAPKAPAAE